MTAPPNHIGDICIAQGDTTGWQNVITRADPVARFAHEVLLDVRNHNGSRHETPPHWPAEVLSLTQPDRPVSCDIHHFPSRPDCPAPHECFKDWKVTVTGANASYVYIIKSYDMYGHSWIGAWPD